MKKAKIDREHTINWPDAPSFEREMPQTLGRDEQTGIFESRQLWLGLKQKVGRTGKYMPGQIKLQLVSVVDLLQNKSYQNFRSFASMC